MITDWPINDHMIVKSVNDHRDHMVQGYSQITALTVFLN
ncbi:unnamed protein product, partial [Staurois parvus]